MLRHLILLVFFCGLCSVNCQQTAGETSENDRNEIKKNNVGANGPENSPTEIIENNFRNPVLEYLFRENNSLAGTKKGVVREIRHSQTLLLPGPRLGFHKTTSKAPEENLKVRTPPRILSRLMSDVKKNGKSDEKVVTSPVLDVKETSSGRSQKPNLEFVKIETYPGTAHLVNRYNVDGSLKSSQTHFHPDFGWKKNVRVRGGVIDQDYVEEQVNDDQERRYALGNRLEENQKTDAKKFATFGRQSVREDHIWPFGDLLKRGRNDLLDLLLGWDFESPRIYTAVSSIVEYQPGEERMREEEEEKYETDLPDEGGKKNLGFALNSNFEIVRSKSEKGKEVDRIERRPLERTRNVGEGRRNMRDRRDLTSIYLKSKDGVKVDISLEEPKEITPKRKKLGESELVLRKGGIAIAGPGGAATAYTGGTAIVGPYGTVYKSPEGTAIVGPYSKIVNITDDTDFEEIIKLHKELQESPSPSVEHGDSTSEAKGFKNYKNIFSYLTNQPLRIEMTPPRGSTERKRPTVVRLKESDLERTVEEAFRLNFRGLVQEAPFNEQTINKNETSLVFRPKSKAEAGRNGVAVSAPISHAILFPGHKASIYFEPESVASAGPSGFAHAHSDLFVSYALNETTTTPPSSEIPH